MMFTVSDNGTGMDKERIKMILCGRIGESGSGQHKSIGIPHIIQRIRLIGETSNGYEALELVRNRMTDLLIIDLRPLVSRTLPITE